MNIITRQQSIKQGLTRYFTGKPCKLGHFSERMTNNRDCVDCRNHKKRKLYREDEEYRQKSLLRRELADSPAKHLARTRKRQAAKIQRTPKWLTADDHALMADYYQMAKDLETIFPWKQHVDHILPLQGKKVSGLHTPLNLQILSKSANLQKSNKSLV